MFKNPPGRRSLAIGFSLLVILLVMNAALSYRSVRQLNQDGQLVSRAMEVQTVLGQVESAVGRATTNQRGFLLTGDAFFRTRFEQNIRELNAGVATLRNLATTLDDFPAQDADMRAAETAIAAHVAHLTTQLDQLVVVQDPRLVEALTGVEALARRDALQSSLAKLRSHQEAMVTRLQSGQAQTYSSALFSLTVTGIIGFLLLGLYVWLVQRYILSRSLAATALQEHRAVLHATLSGIREGVIATDANGKIAFVNPTAERMTAWSAAEALGQPLDFVCSLVDERTNERRASPAGRAMREGASPPSDRPALLIDRRGTASAIEENTSPIVDEGGRVVGAVLVLRDVTERRRQERELIERETQVRSLLDSTAEGIYGLDREGVCTFCNAASLRMLGYERPEDLVGKRLHGLIHRGTDGTPDADRIAEAVRSGQTLHVDDEVLWRADGTSFPAEYRCTPIRREGAIVGSVVTFLDISARRRVEAGQSERDRLIALRAAKAAAMAKDAPLAEVLAEVAGAMVAHLDAAVARIWTLDGSDPVLTLRASAGATSVTDEDYQHVRVGERRVGQIAQTGRPLVDEGPAFDPRATHPGWTTREGIVAFAGFPLRVEGRTVGVMAVLSRIPLARSVLAELPPLADGLAQYIERREAGRRLQESEQRLRLTVEAADIGTWDFNLRTDVLEFSDRCKEMFGLTPDQEVSYERFLGWLHPDDRERVAKAVAGALDPQGDGEYDAEYRILWADESVHWIVAKGQCYFELVDGGREPVRFLGTTMDVTASRMAAAQLSASEARFRQLADAMPQIVWVTRPDGHHEYYNQRWYDYIGCTPEECLGHGWNLPLHPDDKPRTIAAWQHSLATGDPYQIEYRFRSKEGVYRWFLARALPVRDDAGEIVKWYGTCTDIEDNKRAEDDLRRSEEFARSVAESSPDCVKILDLEGRLVWMNENGQQLMGVCKLGEITGRIWQDFWTEGGMQLGAARALEEAIGGRIGRFQGMCRTLTGAARWWDVAVTPIHGPDQLVERILCISRDITVERESQERLRDSEKNLRHVIDSMLPFVGVIDPAGTLIEVNQAALTVSGLKRTDVIGQKFWDCSWWTYDAEVARRIQDAFHRAASGGFVHYDEVARVADDGRLTIDFQLQPVYDDVGLKFVVSSAVDVTDRKRAEDQLANSQQFLRSSLDALSSHIAVLNEEGVILTVNEPWKRFAEENGLIAPFYAVGSNYLDACQPGGDVDGCENTIGEAAPQIRDVIAGTLPRYVAQYPCHSETERRWFQMTVTRFLGHEDVRVVVAHEDITRQIEAQEVMRTRSEQLRKLADVATSLTAANDLQSILRIVTEGARHILQAGQAMTSHVQNRQWAEAVHFVARDNPTGPGPAPEFFPDGTGLSAGVCEENRPARLAAKPISDLFGPDHDHESHATGSQGWLAAPLMSLAGKNMGMIQLFGKVAGDFTEDDESVLVQLSQMASVAIESARLYEQLEESVRRKDEFLAMLGHELRNPLAGIVSGVEALGMLGLPEDAGEMQAVIGRQASHMSRIVDDLLDVSRIVRGKLTLKPEPVNLSELVQNVVKDYSTSQLEGDCRLEVHVPPEDVWVKGDPTRLTQALSNLVHNGCKFGEGSNVVSVTLRSEGGQALISVRDRGIGMTPETLSRIFEPFNQADVSVERSRGGLGLGLALVRGLMRLHGGDATAASAGLGQGSDFTLALRSMAAPADSTESPERAAAQPCRVLLIDDRRDAILPVQSMLRKDGHIVDTASDGPTGLLRAAEFRPDVILCDIGLTGSMNGYDVARALRADPEHRHLYVVAITGYTQDEDRQRARDAGFDLHVKKPVDLNTLREIIGRRLRF